MTVYVRRNVYSLDPNGPEIASLRRGVQVMQSRSMDDPTSWIYQACIHGHPADVTPPPAAIWDQCQHGSFFFLSWHRMYVYWFERILRAASGDPNLALPYWNYSDPAARALPVAFRDPADASNPLYVPDPDRSLQINAGYLLPPSDVDTSLAFSYVNFTAPSGSGLSFGGQEVSESEHMFGPHGQLESQPHDLVHVDVGGQSGLMSYPEYAAQDPIFWLHHANIDRLWKRWLDQGGGRSNPPDNTWLTLKFAFCDENGQQVTMTGQDILDTVNQLGYAYDEDPAGPPNAPFVHEVSTKAVVVTAIPSGSRTILATTGGTNMIKLGNQPVKVSVPLEATTHSKLASMAAADVVRHRIVLNLEGIDYEQNPGVSYEVYINLPQGQEPNYQSDYYVGNLGFFALKPHAHGSHTTSAPEQPSAKRSFDITRNVRALQARGEWHSQVEVTLVMRGLQPPPGGAGKIPVRAQAATTAQPVPSATIQRVTITTE